MITDNSFNVAALEVIETSRQLIPNKDDRCDTGAAAVPGTRE